MGVKLAREREERVEHVADRARRELLATLEELEARRARASAWPRLLAQTPKAQATVGVTALTLVGAVAALGWFQLGRRPGGRGLGRWMSPPVRARVSPEVRSSAARFAAEVARRAALSFVTSWVRTRAMAPRGT